MSEFDEEVAIAAGGWDPRYARVVDWQAVGGVAAALIDVNGDGAEMNVNIYLREDDGSWCGLASGNGSITIPGVSAKRIAADRILLTLTD